MRRFIALALLMSPVLAAAQVPASPFTKWIVGDSVRVSLRDGRKLEGSLQRAMRDSVVLRREAGRLTTDTVMALSHVSLVESGVRRHTAGSAFKGMGLGLLAGSLLGALAAGASSQGCTGEMCTLSILLIPAGAAVGGAGGLLVGAIRTTSTWEIVWKSEDISP
ncbi:MAG: hypothetical protein ABIV10_00060 [Gemmatimonadaceae bacterium]